MREYLSLFMGGGDDASDTHGVTRPPWHLSHCSPSLSWSQNNTSSHLHVPVPVSTDHRFTQDLFEALFLLDFFLEDLKPVSLHGGGVSDTPGDPGSQLPYQEFSPYYLAPIWEGFPISLIQVRVGFSPSVFLLVLVTTRIGLALLLGTHLSLLGSYLSYTQEMDFWFLGWLFVFGMCFF